MLPFVTSSHIYAITFIDTFMADMIATYELKARITFHLGIIIGCKNEYGYQGSEMLNRRELTNYLESKLRNMAYVFN